MAGVEQRQVAPEDIPVGGWDDHALVEAMIFSSSHVFPMVLNAAVQLELFDIMAEAGQGVFLSAAEIVSKLGTEYPEAATPRMDRMLRLLASHSLLKSSTRGLSDGRVERLYGLTPAAMFFVKKGNEGSLSSLTALSMHPSPQKVWLHFKDAIGEGGTQFKKVHGMTIFEYMGVDPAFNDLFNNAMAALTTIAMKSILRVYSGFEGTASLVDVAGGTGKCLNMVVTKYPGIKGINFDLPHVTNTAPSYPGIEHVGGSMFSSIPRADAVMIKDTLHNWDDESCVKILKNCYEALPVMGKVIVLDVVLPEVPETTMESMYVSRLDNTMLMQPGGQERTTNVFRALSEAAGFTKFEVVCTASKLWVVMELRK
ncbi:hypothetical protein MLD38_033685 [Melastoma candidum]|uniref:Uncharacterized protein n=1 Tax=Melastoma candidum TaxID=119954 RepID=A0ACB9M9V1_9MYRT|nr:hypothetical protein MLD38_033685 [Melastoma candidum]